MRSLRMRVAVGVAATLITTAVGAVVGATPAAAAISGVVQVRGTPSATDSQILKNSTATCPAGTVVIATGFELNGAAGDIILDDMIPSTTNVFVQAGEDGDGTNASWNVVAWATCAFRPTGYEIMSAGIQSDPGTLREAIATCSSTSKRVIGAAANLSAGFGQISISTLTFDDTHVFAFGTDDQDGFAGAWAITAYAICADPLPGLRTSPGNSSFDSNSPKSANAPCNDVAGQVALGFGWSVGGSGEVVITFARSFGPSASVTFNEDDDGYLNSWSSTIILRCANV